MVVVHFVVSIRASMLGFHARVQHAKLWSGMQKEAVAMEDSVLFQGDLFGLSWWATSQFSALMVLVPGRDGAKVTETERNAQRW